MRKLSLTDHLFLLLETQKQPMHVAGACVFELPPNAPKDFLYRLIDDMNTNAAKPSFPFNQVLYKTFFWRTDSDFRVEHHFRHIALPKPAGMAELFSYISREHSRIMDRQKPLWELHLIEGLAPEGDGKPERFALYLKIHHAMADGIAAMRMLQMLLSTSPDERVSLPLWSLTTKQRNQIDSFLPINKPAYTIIKEQLGSIVPVCTGLVHRFKDRHLPEFTSSFDAPHSILNQKIKSARRLGAISFAKHRFEKIAEHFGTTTNDVILAVSSGALRQYLLKQNALPKEPLIAFVPISLRKDNSVVGNQISFLLTNLGTHLYRAKDRLMTIAKSTQDSKNRFLKMNQTQIINYSALIYGLAGVNLATGIYPAKQAFNLIISNVPGIKNPLYLNGAKLTAIYPASVLFDGQALNITLANFQDKIDFGITACDTALPHIDELLDFLTQELDYLESLVK